MHAELARNESDDAGFLVVTVNIHGILLVTANIHGPLTAWPPYNNEMPVVGVHIHGLVAMALNIQGPLMAAAPLIHGLVRVGTVNIRGRLPPTLQDLVETTAG